MLVTGATGFLGRHVVTELVARGHQVRALVRPTSDLPPAWPPTVERVVGDVRYPPPSLFDTVDVLIHLAAQVGGSDDRHFDITVVGTEASLEAMARSRTRRVVLLSSFSVYDWSVVAQDLTEANPVLSGPALHARDSYAVAKAWQERVVRRMSEEHGWDVVVLRPGFIWGRDHTWLAGLGLRTGRLYWNIAPNARLPLTHVQNCANLVVLAAESPAATGHTFNVVDDHPVTSCQFLQEHLRHVDPTGIVVPVPYELAHMLVQTAWTVGRAAFGPQCRLPSFLTPARFTARFKPVRCTYEKAREVLGWVPPLDFRSCLEASLGPVTRPLGAEPPPGAHA